MKDRMKEVELTQRHSKNLIITHLDKQKDNKDKCLKDQNKVKVQRRNLRVEDHLHLSQSNQNRQKIKIESQLIMKVSLGN